MVILCIPIWPLLFLLVQAFRFEVWPTWFAKEPPGGLQYYLGVLTAGFDSQSICPQTSNKSQHISPLFGLWKTDALDFSLCFQRRKMLPCLVRRSQVSRLPYFWFAFSATLGLCPGAGVWPGQRHFSSLLFTSSNPLLHVLTWFWNASEDHLTRIWGICHSLQIKSDMYSMCALRKPLQFPHL